MINQFQNEFLIKNKLLDKEQSSLTQNSFLNLFYNINKKKINSYVYEVASVTVSRFFLISISIVRELENIVFLNEIEILFSCDQNLAATVFHFNIQ
jgi:hypothetical protein